MNIIKQEDLDVPDIVSKLKQGQTLVYPTETCYGLGCDASNQSAVDKVFQIKQRQKDKPLLVIAPNVQMVMDYVQWNEKLEELEQKYWPGALTVVARVNDNHDLAEGVVSIDGTLAFRVSKHPLCHDLSAGLGKPLVSTSANITSESSPYDVDDIVSTFQEREFQPDIIIDAGELAHRSPSTVVKVVGDGVEVLRQGGLIIE